MSRFSRARLNKEADGFEREAKRSDEAARDGDRAAKDPNLDPYNQGVASSCASTARSNAREYRHIASVLRGGEIPDNVQLD
ncbi:hypothetical protein [Streptomyces nigrescens]